MPTSDSWVGTWRPHKPRGPISAQFLSPGPKYALPGLTGAWKHDLTKYKAPEYSFGIRHEQSSSDCSPGPKYLIPSNVTRLGTDGSPTFVCSSRTSGSRLYQTPGPGPAAYALPPVLGPKTAPSFSLAGFTKHGGFLEDLKMTPSPAAYKVVDPDVYKHKLPQYSIVGRNFTPDSAIKTPGPGSHYPERVTATRAKTPSFSFGIRHSLYSASLFI
ncbi:ciliary microtubule associated protein 1B [Cynoglossus semilaevis]|uniref:ciliary microtubule associated protein 1B n=1 Tax=Cynoglossus semilaevis TaxID=244447 RepID=UPI000496FF2E|nr:outer dense fiber protein 3-B [Cynoglossus semilaevis]